MRLDDWLLGWVVGIMAFSFFFVIRVVCRRCAPVGFPHFGVVCVGALDFDYECVSLVSG